MSVVIGIIRALLLLPQSKKFLVAMLGFALSRLVPGLNDETRMEIVALAVALVLGIGVADHGKEAAKITAIMQPISFVPSVSPGGVPQAVDQDYPRQ